MAKTYRSYLPEQDLLLPPSLREWLPDEHLVYFVSDVVDQLNLSAIESVYEEDDRGQPPYHPRMMTKILLYGYCVGVFSSRKIQKHLVEDVAFRVLAAGNQPDFRTISDFRKLHLKALEELFQHLGAEVAAWRRRSLKAEGELQEIRARGGVYEGPELSGARQRLLELETENQALRERIDAAKERVRSLAARLAFLEQGGTAS